MRVVCLAGDGIGPEVMEQAIRVLRVLPLPLELEQLPFGGSGIRESGDPLPADTLAACRAADAVLLAAVGRPSSSGPRSARSRACSDFVRSSGSSPTSGPFERKASTSSSFASCPAACTTDRRAGGRTGRRSTRASTTRPDRADRPPRVRARRAAPPGGDRRRQVRRARDVEPLAGGGRRRVVGLPRGRPRLHAGRQCRDAARSRSRSLRRPADREHLRRHPLGRRRRGDGRRRPRSLGGPQRVRPRDLRADPRLGTRHRGPRHREPRRHAALGGADAGSRPRPALGGAIARRAVEAALREAADARSRRERDDRASSAMPSSRSSRHNRCTAG